MIQINFLKFNYPSGDFQLNITEFNIDQGEKIAVIGPSGSGKTTLLNLLSGILIPGGGTIDVEGKKINELQDSERRSFRISTIGFVFQDFELFDYLNVMDNILHPFRINRALKIKRDTRRRVERLTEEMGIGDKLNRFPGDLSQGEKQRAAICRALLPKPKLILADEATGNLDPKNKTRILDLLFQAVDTHDATLIAVTHDHELIDRFDRVIDFKEFMTD